MKKKRSRRQQAIIKRRIFLSFCAVILVSIIAVIGIVGYSLFGGENNGEKSDKSGQSISQGKKEKPKEDVFATVLSTGDIMVHSTQLDGAKVQSGDGYDFSAFFKEIEPYIKKTDLSIGNLEVTFGGKQAGAYSGYPAFNTPDSLADVIKKAGFNFLVTSNNHSYDTGLSGLKRTAEVLENKDIDFIGTRKDESKELYTVKNVNGIKIGMADYTYETETSSKGRKALNGNVISEEANSLIASFSYQNIDAFYDEARSVIENMKTSGAEFIVFYMHWGEEYRLKENTWQKSIAQELSNMGVDIIIGSHPHVIEPIELIHSEDGQNTTICLYSTGNAISNQRQELMAPECTTGHTEDGMLFTYTLKKSGDEVTLDSIDLIPTWVNKYRGGSGYQYTIYPLEKADWGRTKYDLDSTSASKATKSYERTKEIVAEGLTECQREIGCEITFK